MESNYYLATLDDIIDGLEYEVKHWFCKGANGEELPGWKSDNEEEKYFKWVPFSLDLKKYNSFVDDRTSYNRFCFQVDNCTGSNARIKYLDKEDLEDLGYHLLKEDDNYKEFLKIGEFYKYYITICPIFNKDLGVYINIFTNQDTDQTIRFSGFTKNKSELSKLLKQLDIL